MSESNALELVARAQAGDRAAFDALVDATKRRAYGFALRVTGDHDLAADAVQDAYVRAYTSLHRFRRQSAFTTWLYRIVVNASLDAMRSRSRNPEPLTFAGDEDREQRNIDLADTSATPHHEAERRERQEIVLRSLQLLSEDHRTVLVLFDLEGLSYEEISEIVDVPLGTIKSRINRARLALRDVIKPHMELFWRGSSPTTEEA
ncbi:MAG TPA: sigma-70 family RNA polymerase sigma factor [Armatimonadota bacterium]|nr:sigma-70 family RNA polymerase sigma factor [Armatimonadota bacterium]